MEGSARDVFVNRGKGDVRLGKLIGHKNAQAIDDGEAQFWPDFNNMGIFRLPGNKIRRIAAAVLAMGRQVEFSGAHSAVGLLLWRRPGEPFICLEPTVGYQDGSNTELKVWPDSTAGLVSSISV